MIRRATGCTKAEWDRCWPMIREYWHENGVGLVNETQMEVYRATLAMHERAQARAQVAAQASAQARRKVKLKKSPPSPSPSPSSVPDKPPTAPAKDPPDQRVREFLTWFQAEYAKRRNGAVYKVNWPKEGKIAKCLLAVYPPERLQRHALILLTTKEPWVDSTDRGIGILSTKINWLEERLASWEATHPKPASA